MTSQQSTNKATRVLFIFAGYPEEMQNTFLPYNPGMERRITHTFTFGSMSSEELGSLAVMNMQHKEGWEIDVEDLDAFTRCVGQLIEKATTPRQRQTNNGNVADKLLELVKLQLVSRMRMRGSADQKLVTEEIVWRAASKLGDGSMGGLALRADEAKPSPVHWTGLGALEKVSASTRQQRLVQQQFVTPPAKTCPQEDTTCTGASSAVTHAVKQKSRLAQMADTARNLKLGWQDAAFLFVAVAGCYCFWPVILSSAKLVSSGLILAAATSFAMTFGLPLMILAAAWFAVCVVMKWDCMCELFNDLAVWLLCNPSAWPAAMLLLYLFGSKRIQIALLFDFKPASESNSICTIGLAVPGYAVLSKDVVKEQIVRSKSDGETLMPPPPPQNSSNARIRTQA